MKSYPPEPSGITLLTAPEGSPDETVSLIRSEGFKFLAGINHNTPIYNYHIDEHHYYNIACKELHWKKQEVRKNLLKLWSEITWKKEGMHQDVDRKEYKYNLSRYKYDFLLWGICGLSISRRVLLLG